MWGLNRYADMSSQCIFQTYYNDRFQRPPWSTGILITGAFLCGIFAGVFIWRGGQKTKRTKEVKERLLMALATAHPDDVADDNLDRPKKASRVTEPTKSTAQMESIRESRSIHSPETQDHGRRS
jgi:hypothetical protein